MATAQRAASLLMSDPLSPTQKEKSLQYIQALGLELDATNDENNRTAKLV